MVKTLNGGEPSCDRPPKQTFLKTCLWFIRELTKEPRQTFKEAQINGRMHSTAYKLKEMKESNKFYAKEINCRRKTTPWPLEGNRGYIVLSFCSTEILHFLQIRPRSLWILIGRRLSFNLCYRAVWPQLITTLASTLQILISYLNHFLCENYNSDASVWFSDHLPIKINSIYIPRNQASKH